MLENQRRENDNQKIMQILVEFDKQTIIDKDPTFILTAHFEIG